MRVQIDIVQCQALAERLRTQHIYVQDACAHIQRARQLLPAQSCEAQKEQLERAIKRLHRLKEELTEKEEQLLRITEVYRSCEEEVLNDIRIFPEERRVDSIAWKSSPDMVFPIWKHDIVKMLFRRPAIQAMIGCEYYAIFRPLRIGWYKRLVVPNEVRDFVTIRMKSPLSELRPVPWKGIFIPGCQPTIDWDWLFEEMRRRILKWWEEYQKNKEGGVRDAIIGGINRPERFTLLYKEQTGSNAPDGGQK